MKKPNNFENTQAQGEFTPVEFGGHYLIIKDVTETQSKNGKDMIKVSLILQQMISSRDISWNLSKMISVRRRNGQTRQHSIS